MGSLRDLVDRLDTERNALMKRLGGAGQAAADLTLPAILEVLALGQQTRASETLPVLALNPESIHAMLQSIGARQRIPITADEAREVAALLTTGELFADLETALVAALRFGRATPDALVEDALALPELPTDLAAAIRQDLHDDPIASPREVLIRLRDGQIDRTVLTNTFRVLLASATPQVITSTVRTLVAPDNRTVRLAVVVYARLHGVDIDIEDLNAVYSAVDPTNPDLSPLFTQGLTKVRDRVGRAEDALALLRRLSRS